jgi:hypothetical protein
VPAREKLEGFGAYLKVVVKKFASAVLRTGSDHNASDQSLLASSRRDKKASLNERRITKLEV